MRRSNFRKLFRQVIVITIITIALFVILGEVVLRHFFPQALLFPRWEANRQYGVVLPASTTMRHWRPGHWEFRYTIDAERCRVVYTGQAPDAPVIAVLGDSYAMGMGVNDAETFPAVLAAELRGRYRVLNCGSPGWGLTQEVRRFHEYVRAYNPRIVVLQFCANDPEDGVRDAVARYVDGKPVFDDTQRRFNPVFRALSGSRIAQSSQIYALLRVWYETRRDRGLAHAAAVSSDAERAYVSLLESFAADLHARGVRLLFINVNGQLEPFPAIRACVKRLDGAGQLEYLEVEPWFEGMTDFGSPEGHRWGWRAHAVVGRELARYVAK